MKAYELLSSLDRWTKGYFARDEHENLRSSNDPDAVKWCAAGAIHKCYRGSDTYKVFNKLERRIGHITISVWNDDSSYIEVITVLKELDI